MILSFIDSKPLNAEVMLQRIFSDEEIYLLKCDYDAHQYFKEGNVIWYKDGEQYLVYSLNQDLPSKDVISIGISAKMILDEIKKRNA